jgi:hypothetical protein
MLHFCSSSSNSVGLVRVAAAAALMVTLAGGCAGGRETTPLHVVRDVGESAQKRVKAVEQIREQQSAGARAGEGTITPRDVYKEIAWTVSQPPKLRAAVVDALLNDRDEKIVADAKEMAKLMLPKESAREVVVVICRNAGTKGWKDFTPAIVRSYSRTLPGVTEADRCEHTALKDLHPGVDPADTAMGVFLDPPKVPPTEGIDWTMRYRTDAWNVLARLDPDGAKRRAMLAGATSAKGDAVLEALVAARDQLRIVPLTGEELAWLVSLHDARKKENASWWKETAQAVAKTPADAGDLRLRHLEAVRWAAANAPELFSMNRQQLTAGMQARLSGREFHQRTVRMERKEDGPTKSELFEKRCMELSWGDLLSLTAIDRAIREPQVVKTLLAQSESDRADTSTEYGGLLAFRRGGQAETPVVMLYMPRGSQRHSDTQFVASDDMIGSSDLALAHYHFHVQKERNAEYAGPSIGDLDYAARYGRACVVFTSVKEGELAADYYQPGDVTIDLGSIKAAP